MKNGLLLSGLILAHVFFCLGNGNAQCDNFTFESIAANKIKAGVTNMGGLFHDAEGEAAFVAPFVPGTPAIHSFAGGYLWLGAYDELDSLKVAATTFSLTNDGTDYWPGPIDDATGEPLPDGCQDFNRIWRVSRGEILLLIEDFETDGIVNEPLSQNLLTWPGKGNPHFTAEMGFDLPFQELAPFFDRNGNSRYEPMDGDYPLIDPAWPEVVPDEMLWCVFNDVQGEHEGSGGAPLGVEVHLLTYAFNCSENEVLNHTVFTRHKIFNKSGGELHDFRLGLWADGVDQSWGGGVRPILGCDTTLNSIYFYNETNNATATNQEYYGENPPVQSVTFLNHELEKLAYFFSSTFGSPAPAQDWFIPIEPIEFYNYLSGKWRFGVPYTYGGRGYDLTSTDTVCHVFFDNPNWPGWSIYYDGIPEEPEPVMSKGFLTVAHGEYITLDAAYSFHREPDSNHLQNVNVALENIPEIQAFFDSGFDSGCTQFGYCASDCVWPGDANADGIAKEDDLLYLAIGIADGSNGPDRVPPSNIWSPQPAEAWGVDFFDGTEFKHADCNGDGLLDNLDVSVLDLNFYQKNTSYVPSQVEAPMVGGELYVSIWRNAITTQDGPQKRFTRATVSFETEEPLSPAISGISFVIEFDTSKFTIPTIAAFNMVDEENSTMFGPASETMSVIDASPEIGRFAFGIARKDGVAVDSAFQDLVRFGMEFREDYVITSPDSFEYVKLKIYDAFAATADGEIIPLGAISDSILVTNLDTIPTATIERFLDELALEISPNPNNGSFTLHANTDQTLALTIFDLQGKTVWRSQMPVGQAQLEVDLGEHLRSGIYLLRAVGEDGHFATRKLLVK